MAGELVFVTGGTGFLGRHLVPFLLDKDYRVRLFVRPTSDTSWISSERVEYVIGDISDAQAIKEGVTGCRYAVHAAGNFRFWGSQRDFQPVNFQGTKNVCMAVLESDVERMVYISSVAVVGDPPRGEIIDEDTICHPKDNYQKSKYNAENLILEMTKRDKLPGIILRPGAYYGPGSRYGFNRLFIEEPMRGLRIQIENGRHFTFPVFVSDVPSVIVKTLKLGIPGEIYNVSDQSITHAELNQLISPLLGISTWRLNVPRALMIVLASLMELLSKLTRREPFYPLNLRYYVFRDWKVLSHKANRDLDFEPTPIEEGLKQTVAWYKRTEWKK